MRVAFDTSVLVAGLVQAHPRFVRSALWLDAVGTGDATGFWTAHAWAETWSVLSRLPVVERLEPADVTRILDSVADAMAPTPLRMKDYRDAAARCAAAGARYGALFDALHLVAAERAGVDALLTWNDGDFRRFSPRIPILAPPPRLGLPG